MRLRVFQTWVIGVSGPTGAGKTTFTRTLGQVLESRNISYGLITEHGAGASFLPSYVCDSSKHGIRTDFWALPWFACGLLRHPVFSLQMIRDILGQSSTTRERLAIFRSFLRKMAIFSRVRMPSLKERVVVFDEELFHFSHNLLISQTEGPDSSRVQRFGRLVPLPSRLLILTNLPVVLVQRLTQRGGWSPRIKNQSELVRFTRHAHMLFDWLAKIERIEKKSLVLVLPEMNSETSRREAVELILPQLLRETPR